ncbi:MAG TPA: glutamate--tRNA ligase, partial [Syntrophales bacterium]|nr:glutamate--tRNA ligase [Syntrophales bacterium]
MKRDKRVRVRFAPSPTGDLHVGNARTALLNWLFARHHGGDFILRVEDTDRVRTSDVYERNILEDLMWLGIDWDEGPEKDGPFGPYRQSGRLEIYRGYLERLVAEGRAYRCYCTEEELEKERAGLLSRGKAPRYGGRCRNLTVEQGKKFDDEGRAYAYRFRVEEGLIEFTDLIRGPMKFNAEDIGDFIVLRSNAVPAYNFAVVIDDYLMKVSHVIRGEDHLSNTAAQLMLYAAFGFTPPVFAHHALILGKDRAKLSKRHGSVTVREFRRQGILPEAMVNYLALMGSSYGEGREVMTLAEIVNEFSLDRIGKGGAVFDEEKLDWL